MNIHEWKRSALNNLLEIEGRESVYGHQKDIDEKERPSIFYTIPEKKMTIDEVLLDLDKNLSQSLPPSELSTTIKNLTLKLVEKSKGEIRTMSSLFIALETDWGKIDEQFTRKKFYDHYHPPRGDKSEISTLSYFAPIHLEDDITEALQYCDMTKLNISGKPYRYWRENNPADIAKDFEQLSKRTTSTDWKELRFPKLGFLQIGFDSFNNLHNISGLTGNIFLTIVINDVEMILPLSAGEMRSTYFES